MNRIILSILMSIPLFLVSQDKGEVFTEEKMLWYVKNFHPYVQQADLIEARAKSEVLKARGAFDPKLNTNIDQKYFGGKQYYNLINAGLKVPTWYGVEVKTGYDQTGGIYVNAENNTPIGGLWYAGLSVSLGSGLLMDERRATLKQAQIFTQSTDAQKQVILNNLYFDAIKQYWKWVNAYNQFIVYQDSKKLAEERFEGVKKSFIFGDKPAIDTLEAYIQIQNRMLNEQQALLDLQNQALLLSNYLWLDNNMPLEITSELKAPLFDENEYLNFNITDSIAYFLNNLTETHPELQLYDFKLENLDVERKLKFQKMLPKLNLKYNILNEPLGANIVNNLSINNYKWGLDFSFPILIRAARGDLQLTKIKIENTKLNQQQKTQEIRNKVSTYFNQQTIIREQVELYNSTVRNYERMLEGEQQKLNAGESSLFIVNSRENKFIQAKIKQIALITKYQVSIHGLDWAMGRLN